MRADTPGITSFSAEAILFFFLIKLFFFLLFKKGNFDIGSVKSHFKCLVFVLRVNPTLACGVLEKKKKKKQKNNRSCLFSIPFSHQGRNPSLNIGTEEHLCGVDVTDLPGLPLTKAKVSLAGPTQWPFNQATALLRTQGQCYFLSQNYKDRVLQET